MTFLNCFSVVQIYTQALARLMDTHINIIFLFCPSHNSPIGHCHRNREKNPRGGRQRGVKVLPGRLQACLLLNLSYVCVCVLSLSSSACSNVLPSCLSVHSRACILTVSSFARKISLQRPTACCHSSPRCQNVVSSKQSDDILSVIQSASIYSHWIEQTAPAPVIQMEDTSGVSSILIILGH